MMRHTELLHPYFATDWWQNPDVRHVNARGHRDMANILASFVQDVACEYTRSAETDFKDEGAAAAVETDAAMIELLKDVFEIQDPANVPVSEMRDVGNLANYWEREAVQARPWGPWHRAKEDDEPARIQHGVWSEEKELGQVPRVSTVLTSSTSVADILVRSFNHSFDFCNIGVNGRRIYRWSLSASARVAKSIH
jgi:hypothetical protein